MKSSLLSSGRFLALLALAVLVCAVPPASAQGFKWWQDEGYKRELGLTSEQSTRLEDIFQKSSPTLRQHKEAFDRAQAEFDRTVERGDDTMVMEQVDLVEHARAELNKARVMMLLRMRRTLTTDQWAKFTALNERNRAARERAGGRR
jgi:Spy/CpxP family protein refolding chaperone